MSALRLPSDRINSEAKMARDPEGNYPTKVFSRDETFYCVAELSNAPDNTSVRAL